MPVDDLLEAVADGALFGDGVSSARVVRIVTRCVIPLAAGLVAGLYLAFAFGWLPLAIGAVLMGVGWVLRRNPVVISFGLGLALSGVWGLVQYLSVAASL